MTLHWPVGQIKNAQQSCHLLVKSFYENATYVMLVPKKCYYFWSCTRLLNNLINKVLKLSKNDFIAVSYEWEGICMNFPSDKTSFYSFDHIDRPKPVSSGRF